MEVRIAPATQTWEAYAEQRLEMVEKQLRRRGISDERVLWGMARVPRHAFVAGELSSRAYQDEPLPIGDGQTISQPYIVAAMTEALRLQGGEKVLEIGTGCGYQAAILSCLAEEVHTVEVRPELARSAEQRMQRLGFENVRVYCGDGSQGWPECAPFDAILVAAAAPALPEPLFAQLAEGGRLIAPVGAADYQTLICATKHRGALSLTRKGGCRFVPLLGQFGWKEFAPR